MNLSQKKYILGISAYYHDSAAALLADGEIIAAAQEERFTRKKHDSSFPQNAVKYVLDEGNISLSDLSMVVFYDKPYIKFERLLETYHAFAPRGFTSFLSAMSAWIKDKLFMRKTIQNELRSLVGSGYVGKLPQLLFSEHHLSHAASAFYPSPFQEAAILTVDGVGEWTTTAIGYGDKNNITFYKELFFPHSLGLLYSAFTYYCGFKVNSGEYKLMGLAPYGKKGSERVKKFKNHIYEELVDVRDDGSLLLNMKYFNFATGLTMCNDKRWEALFGIPRREYEANDPQQEYMDMALAIQEFTEEVMLKLARTAKNLTGSKKLCLAGGVALNCVANGVLERSGLFEHIWIQPAAGDAGGALGAAYVGHYLTSNEERVGKPIGGDAMKGAYLGPQFLDADIERVARKYNAQFSTCSTKKELIDKTIELLAKGNVVGWFQGRMEYGPRALGNRSILGDPRDPRMQKRLNLKIKKREGFRPFAPSVREEDAGEYFEREDPSPYMLFVSPVKKEMRMSQPEHLTKLYDRLYNVRSEIPAITHIDYSARIQTVSRDTNPLYWDLIRAFKEKTGCGVVVNTSFNVRGEPVVCTPDDAFHCFMSTNMDVLVMGSFVFEKTKQNIDTKDFVKDYEMD